MKELLLKYTVMEEAEIAGLHGPEKILWTQFALMVKEIADAKEATTELSAIEKLKQKLCQTNRSLSL